MVEAVHESAEEVAAMKHGKLPFHILAILLLAFGIGLAIAGGPVIWVVLVMLSPPLILLYAVGETRRAGPNPHFAAPPPPRHARPLGDAKP
jgi:hypothetical protein